MNDSKYGLTASIWTSPTDPASIEAFHALANDLETGTGGSSSFLWATWRPPVLTRLLKSSSTDATLSVSPVLPSCFSFVSTCLLSHSLPLVRLDPALAWTGVKESGRGVSLSQFGFDQLVRLKSIHMKEKI